MRKRMIFKFGVTIIIFIAVFMYYHIQQDETSHQARDRKDDEAFNDLGGDEIKDVEIVDEEEVNGRPIHSDHWKNGIHLSVVACGDRAEETLILLKSAILFTTEKPLVFHIYSEYDLQPLFRQQVDYWPPEYKKNMMYFIYNISYPAETAEAWKKLFKPCASQRLFIPSLLTDVDSLLYVDTDILFLRSLKYIWSFFEKFNSTQLAALAPEHEDPGIGWYNRFARHPYYGTLGLNSGVMLMNLTRLRNSTWLESIKAYNEEYKLKITWGDQDLINIYFHFHPGQLYVYPCEWNYRPDLCMYMSVCKDIDTNGISVLHGSRRVMHNDKQPAFKAVYQAFKEHQFSSSVKEGLLRSMKHHLSKVHKTPCGQIGPIVYTKHIEEFVMEHS